MCCESKTSEADGTDRAERAIVQILNEELDGEVETDAIKILRYQVPRIARRIARFVGSRDDPEE